MADSADFYRKGYERMLREFARLEERDLQLVKLFKLTLSRTLLVVEEAYPSLDPLCHRIRGHARRQADADFPLEQMQRDIDQLSERIRTLESTPPERDDAPGETASPAYQRKVFVREFLPPLLEGIALIEPLEPHRKRLLDGIRDHEFDARPSLLVERTIALINEMRQRIEQEKAELAQFLDEIRSSVQEIEEDAFHQGIKSEEHRGKLKRFDKMLGRSVSKLKREIEQAQDVDTIKQSVRDQIEHLHKTVREFHETERERLAEFESQNRRLRGYLSTVIHRAQMQEAKLKQQCSDRNRCALTALPNAFAFEQHLQAELARLAPGRLPKSLVYVEIDHFDELIRSEGQETADRILVVIVQVISRKIHYNDFLARIGPGRFAVILAEQDSAAGIELADRIHIRMKRTQMRRGGRILKIRVSCGVTDLEIGQTTEEVYQHVLQALDQVRHDHGDHCQRVVPPPR